MFIDILPVILCFQQCQYCNVGQHRVDIVFTLWAFLFCLCRRHRFVIIKSTSCLLHTFSIVYDENIEEISAMKTM